MNIRKIKILLTNGADKVMLYTNKPCPFVKEFLPSQPNLELTFECTYDTAKEYVKNNFPNIAVEVFNVR